uniref:Uncharacterized protein n=1 Tax=Anguilla anguilla TaxID=7936 RepID=A0A0E9WBC9_ANGAN
MDVILLCASLAVRTFVLPDTPLYGVIFVAPDSGHI